MTELRNALRREQMEVARLKEVAKRDITILKETYELELFKAREEAEGLRRDNQTLRQKIRTVKDVFSSN